ncbi:MAG: DNA-3-methyladenine glycosylase [Candidatus Marinimicrobia bacterium]|nr:DNA-3-methyladenine glycosylase [Candidatus Neomarinimicrobiota bacterium]
MPARSLPLLTPLPRAFYDRPTATVAEDLLGRLLVYARDGVRRVGRIVETEAYLGAPDRASHSARGPTPRNQVMFGPPGYAYVYLVYGMHHCLNVVTEAPGRGAAVLLRALEPIHGLEAARMQGPALLCRALGIDRSDNGRDLVSADFFVAAWGAAPREPVVRRPRIGVDYAGAWARRLLRFYLRGNPYVSRP